MGSLSPNEYRRLKKEAREFGRRAQAGKTYYVVGEVGGIKSGRRVSEVRFKKKFGIGLMAGSVSPEQLYLRHGEVYEDRDHPDIAGLLTWPAPAGASPGAADHPPTEGAPWLPSAAASTGA